MSDAVVPMEPLSARVADVGYEKKSSQHEGETSEKRYVYIFTDSNNNSNYVYSFSEDTTTTITTGIATRR